jgi:hypothetical protein
MLEWSHAGIHEILVATPGEERDDFLRLLGNRQEFGLKHKPFVIEIRSPEIQFCAPVALAASIARHKRKGVAPRLL